MTAQEIKNHFLKALAEVLDDGLRKNGFLRRKTSTTYRRAINQAEQEIEFVVDYFPEYQPGAEAHIHPMLRVKISDVSKAALGLVGGDSFKLGGAPDIILNEPIEFTAPKEKHERWFATGNDQLRMACLALGEFINRWAVPFLSDLTSAGDLVKVYEANDQRVMKQTHWYVFVAAAYAVLGQTENAREVVQIHLGKPGLKMQYSAVYKNLGIT